MKDALLGDIPPALLDRFKHPAPRYSHYPLPRVWRDPLNGVQYAEALGALGQRDAEAVSLYVHLPFCAARCLYCGCNTTIPRHGDEVDSYLDTLEHEMDLVAAHIGTGRDVRQLRLGGGTPNFLSEPQLVRLWDMIDRHFHILGETDSCIQCDPRRTTPAQLELLRGLGLRQISLGVQDLDPNVQRAIGRIQSHELLQDVYWEARAAGFESVKFDLLYGLPWQTEQSFRRTIDEVIELGPDRIACFGYSHQPELRPHQRAIELSAVPSPGERLALFHCAVSSLVAAGYTWIGLDHFALDTDELSIALEERRLHRDLMGYSTTANAHTLAFGVSGLGEVEGTCVQNDIGLRSWHESINAGRLPIVRGHRLNDDDRRRRQAIMQLMCNLELPASLASSGLEDEYRRLSRYAEDGLVEVSQDRITVTPRGRYFLGNLCMEQDAYLRPDVASWQPSRTN